MLGLMSWFNRARTPQRRSAFPKSTRLRLEQLETRDCPSGFVDSPLAPSPLRYGPIQMSGPDIASPSISLAVTMNGLKSVTLSGLVTAVNPGNLIVTFTGAVNALTTTDTNGNFSLTINADKLGQVQAATQDTLGHSSNTATATVATAAPVISNFGWVAQSGGWFLFTGQVTGLDAGNMTVILQGAPASFQKGVEVKTTPNGSFSFLIKMNPTSSEQGMVYASCTDCWGQLSNEPSTYVTQPTVG